MEVEVEIKKLKKFISSMSKELSRIKLANDKLAELEERIERIENSLNHHNVKEEIEELMRRTEVLKEQILLTQQALVELRNELIKSSY